MMDLVRRAAASAAAHVLFAFIGMGGWAVYANWDHAMPAPLIAGAAQGAMSGAITYFLKTAVDGLRARLPRGFGAWAPPLIACSISACVLVAVHAASGTPEILKTVAVPLTVATSYALIYNFTQFTAERKAT
ncbi:MAG: hypothetical protein KF899_10740 [Parvibaculum sp.]|nr:hypothetical protein [Parvibaculum sp.]